MNIPVIAIDEYNFNIHQWYFGPTNPSNSKKRNLKIPLGRQKVGRNEMKDKHRTHDTTLQTKTKYRHDVFPRLWF